MGRFRNLSSQDSTEATVDISPLIDCVFILLIFFIVTTTFVEETGVEVDKPEATPAAQPLEKNSILLAITADGAVVYGGKDIGLHGVQPTVKRLIAKEELPVIIQVDQSVKSGTLVQVIGEVKLAGVSKVSVATKKGAG